MESLVMVSGAAPSASVALDIGNGRGALVIYPDERFRGREIEISRADGRDLPGGYHRHGQDHDHAHGEGPRVHTGVHERSAQSGSRLTAIFGSLPAGDYVIWEDDESLAGEATVGDGAVAEIHLP